MVMSDPFDDWPPAKQDSGKEWNETKLTILRLLWPMQWVEGSTIFEAVQQTYYDRRIRELRESGWQIETHGKKYRLLSHEKLPGQERQYPSAQQKREVLQRDKGTCQICRLPDENLQYDHKIPLDRNGPTEVENLQLLCSACNVEKRGACKRCKLETCDSCPYAYPELYGSRLVLSLDATAAERLRADSQARGVPDKLLAEEILSHHYGITSEE